MSLPKIDLPIFEVELPSTGEKVKFRPFTVKEEKILLVAQESDDPAQQILSTKQVVNNCLINKDVSEISMFDLEYLILSIRGRSVDNSMKFAIKDPDTEETVELEVNLEEVKVTIDERHKKEIRINEDYVLFLKYPTIDEFIKISEFQTDDPLVNYYILTTCLDKVASNDEVHYFKDYTNEEVDSFMENLTSNTIKGIELFFETMPKLRHEMKYKNSEGKEQTFVIEGMRSFFI